MSFIRALILSLSFVGATAHAADWLYLDLGDVIVSGNPTDGYAYVAGAREFVMAQRAEGRKIALLSNIPESWGATCDAKFATLKEFLGTRFHEAEAFSWTMFDAVILPPYDRYRKPKPFVFLSALGNACPGRAAYIGESAVEIDAAGGLGFATFHKEQGSTELPTGSVLENILGTFSYVHPADCDFAMNLADVKEPQDADVDIQACVITP